MISIGLFYVIFFGIAVGLSAMFVGAVIKYGDRQHGLPGILFIATFLWCIVFGLIFGMSHREEVYRKEIIPQQIIVDNMKSRKIIIINSEIELTTTEAKYVNNILKVFKVKKQNRWGSVDTSYDYQLIEE